MIEDGFKIYLTDTDTGSAALAVAEMIKGEIYGGIAPAFAKLPRLVYSEIGYQNTQSLCRSDKTVRKNYLFDCYAKTKRESRLLATALREAMVDYRGFMGDTKVKTITLDSELDLLDPDPGLFRVEQSYVIWLVE